MEQQKRLDALLKLMQVGHCAESRSAVHNTCDDDGQLIGVWYYFAKQCTQKDFPSLEFLRANFGTKVAPWGGYIDTIGKVKAHPKNVFWGTCNATAEVTGYNISICWVRHDSKLEVWVRDNAHLHVDSFENSEVLIHIESSKAKVYVNTYADSKVRIEGYTERAVVTNHDCKTYK